MIKKIIIFSENSATQFEFIKTPASLRLAYALRSKGYEVKQVHNCVHFNKDELQSIIENFSKGEKVCALISTSFISHSFKYYTKEKAFKDPKSFQAGYYWSDKTNEFFRNVLSVLKKDKHTILMGGFEIIFPKFLPDNRYAWGCDYLSEYVDFFVVGNDTNIIEKVCKGEQFNYQQMGNSRVVESAQLIDFTDCASTPIINDHIEQGESLATEIAAGCIFSCQFCNYAALGKKKHEYMRTYDSFKREIVSNYENFKTKMYLFTDNLMNDNLEKLKFIIRVREETGIDIRWSAFVRLDTIKTKEQARMISESGAAGITVGIETMKKEIGPYIGKVTDRNRVIASLNLLREAVGNSAIISSGFIAGLPTETPEELHKTYEWLHTNEGKSLLDHYHFSYLRVFVYNKDKNEINAARKDPFSEYVIGKNSGDWVSPWGNSKQFFDICKKYNDNMSTNISGFIIPAMQNLGMTVEDIVALSRKHDRLIEDPILLDLKKVNQKKINEYKKKLLTFSST